MHELSNSQREEIEKMAYQLWEERGGPLGSPDHDWFRAEQEFKQRTDSPSGVPVPSLATEPLKHDHRSTSMSADGLEQQISTLPVAGGSSGSGS
jgi:hypothetical protein